MNIFGAEARAIGFHQKSADIVVFIFYFGPDDSDVGDRARGDPHLLAVQHVLFPDSASARAHSARVGTEVRLGQTKTAKLFALLKCRKPFLFLLFAAECVNRIHDQR